MSLSTDLRTFLLADAPIAALVGTRVYRSVRNQGDGLPAIRIAIITDPSDHALDGVLSARDATVQIDCYDDDWIGVDTLADTVETAFDGYSGAMGARTCQVALLKSRQDLPDSPEFGKQQNTPRVSLDFAVGHNT